MQFRKGRGYPMRTSSRNLVVAIVILIAVARVGVATELYTGPMIDAHATSARRSIGI